MIIYSHYPNRLHETTFQIVLPSAGISKIHWRVRHDLAKIRPGATEVKSETWHSPIATYLKKLKSTSVDGTNLEYDSRRISEIAHEFGDPRIDFRFFLRCISGSELTPLKSKDGMYHISIPIPYISMDTYPYLNSHESKKTNMLQFIPRTAGLKIDEKKFLLNLQTSEPRYKRNSGNLANNRRVQTKVPTMPWPANGPKGAARD